MPSRASTSFLPEARKGELCSLSMCQCPHGLIPHFYSYTAVHQKSIIPRVNALTGLYLISTQHSTCHVCGSRNVSMPSRAYTSFLPGGTRHYSIDSYCLCQCPLGLILHFYAKEYGDIINIPFPCQCPLGLIPHFYR